MALTVENPVRSAVCNAVVDLVDVGSPNGYVEIRDSAVVLCTINFSANAFGNATNGVATLSGVPKSASASGTGAADNYKVYDANGLELWSGTVGTAGTDMILDTVNIDSGDTVTITSWTHTVPAT